MGMHINPLLFEEEHLVRQVEIDGEFWFVGLDVCRVLGLANPRSSLALLDEDERRVHTMDGDAGERGMILVSEPGIYRLVFKSRKPVAERFKRWLAHEVIPAIRKTGSFGQAQSLDGDVMPDPQAKRPFPDWPMEEMRTKRGCVDMYRLLYGAMAAQWVCPQLGFPVPPIELVEHGKQFSLVLVPQEDAT